MNSGHKCVFRKVFWMFLFSDNEQNVVTLPHTAQQKYEFLVKTKENSKPQKQIPKKKLSLEWLHQRLGHRSTRSLLDGDIEFFWNDIELRIYPDPFYTSCQISTMCKKSVPKTPLKPKKPFKWVLRDTITDTSSKRLKKYTNFSNYLLIVDTYYKITKLYGMENITTEEVMDKLDTFQAIFGKWDEFGWWDMEIIQTDSGTQFTSKEFQEGLFVRVVNLALAAPDNQEMNEKVELTWWTLRTIEH